MGKLTKLVVVLVIVALVLLALRKFEWLRVFLPEELDQALPT